MKRTFPFKSVNFFSILCFFSVLFFLSCSENLPEVRSADYSMIFEYETEDSYPTARLSVFVETLSDVRRADELILVSENSDYYWDTNDLVLIENSSKRWAGHTNFILPEPEKIPVGKYLVTYIDAAGEEVEATLNLDYNPDLYSMKASQVDEYMKKNGNLKKLAIYDDFDTLVYFGYATSELETNSKILNHYRSAATKNVIWCKSDNTVLCILPREKLR